MGQELPWALATNGQLFDHLVGDLAFEQRSRLPPNLNALCTHRGELFAANWFTIKYSSDAICVCRHERIHLTWRRKANSPARSQRLQQRAKFDAFVREFNAERPHEALWASPTHTSITAHNIAAASGGR
jgi:hypothetical protein